VARVAARGAGVVARAAVTGAREGVRLAGCGVVAGVPARAVETVRAVLRGPAAASGVRVTDAWRTSGWAAACACP